MDKKVKKYYLTKFFLGLFGYFIGGTLFVLIGGSDTFYRLLASAAFSGILYILVEFLYAKRNPTLRHKIEIEEQDERGQIIQGKAGVFTFMLTMLVLLLILFMGAYLENTIISYGAAGLALFQITSFVFSSLYWSSKL